MRTVTLLVFVLANASVFANTPWNRDYFPNVILTDQDGQTHRFFDDLIEGKIVAINFIYTSCPDTCPVETAQLVKVQRILGDSLGKEVFLYSITIDPETDTPDVLKEYKEKFRAKWTFLTGSADDIVELRKKLGLYVEEIQDGSNNHNVTMIIGNQASGRWMRRSPFENPYVLADQLGNWLTEWKPAQRGSDYDSAPRLRNISYGEQLFRTRCATCHSIGGDNTGALGPNLVGVTERRDYQWLVRWLKEPDKMLAEGEPLATQLFRQWNELPMPNQRLNQGEVMDILEYIKNESVSQKAREAAAQEPAPSTDVVAIMNAWVKEAVHPANINAGYLTIVNASETEVVITGIESEQFDSVAIHSMAGSSSMMQEIYQLKVASGAPTRLEPGGMHLMMYEPSRHYQPGDHVEVTLHFSNGGRQAVLMPVRAAPGASGSMQGMKH